MELKSWSIEYVVRITTIRLKFFLEKIIKNKKTKEKDEWLDHRPGQ